MNGYEESSYAAFQPNRYGNDPLIFPQVAVEIENVFDFDKIAYCLWKLLCVRSSLRVLICCQPTAQKIEELRLYLGECIDWEGLCPADQSLLIYVGDESVEKQASWKEYYAEFEWRNAAIRQASPL